MKIVIFWVVHDSTESVYSAYTNVHAVMNSGHEPKDGYELPPAMYEKLKAIARMSSREVEDVLEEALSKGLAGLEAPSPRNNTREDNALP